MADYIKKIRTKDGDKQIDYDALANNPVTNIISESADTAVVLRDLASGTYRLQGKFRAYTGATGIMSFSSALLVNIVKATAKSSVQIYYPVSNCVQFMEITDTDITRTNVYLNKLVEYIGTLTNLTTTAKTSLVDAINELKTSIDEIDAGTGSGSGTDAVSPTISISEIEGGHRLTITDANGTKTVDVMDGTDGNDGTSVTITSVSESTESGGENVVNFSDGKTVKVKNGKDGSDGVSPSVTVTEIDDGHRVSVTDANGTKTFDVLDGADGQDGVADTSTLPDYWESYLPDKISAVKTLQTEGGKDAFSFIVITDIHYGNNGYGDYGVGGWSVERAKADGKIGNEGWSPLLAKRIADECNIKYVLCLGDVYNRYAQGQTIDNVQEELEAIKEMLAPIKDRLLITRGNHDVAYGRYDKDSDGDYEGVGDELMCYNLTENELHEFFYRPVSMIDGVHFDESGTGYYVDDTANKVRFIILNTHCNPSTLAEDGTALYNSYGTFRFTQSQFDLVEEALLGVPSNSWSVIVASHAPIAGSYGVDAFDGEAPVMRAFLNAYQNKTTYKGTFAGTGGVVEDEVELPYTNLSDATTKLTSPTSTSQDGWFLNCRISESSGSVKLAASDTAAVDTYVSNLIAIKDDSGNQLVSSYLRVKGLDIKTTGRIQFFDSSKTWFAGGGDISNNSAISFESDETIIKIAPAAIYDSSVANAYFVRLQGKLMDGYTVDDVVITIDEEIVEVEQPEQTEKPYDYVSINADFTAAKGQIVGYFSGHTHKDLELTADDWSIKTITSRCDGRAEDSASEAVLNANRTVGTVTEQSFNVFTVNRKTKQIHATKIGAGSDRTINY